MLYVRVYKLYKYIQYTRYTIDFIYFFAHEYKRAWFYDNEKKITE